MVSPFFSALLFGLPSAASANTLRLGGSLSLTGEHATQSMSLLRGITLFAEKINSTGIFRDILGSALAVSLHIEDDGGQPQTVRSIYSRLAAERNVDFFFGPYSSRLTMVAAEIANETQTLAVLAGGAAPTIYQQGFGYIFSTCVNASDYMENGLEILWSMGARTLVSASGEDVFSSAVCHGARAHASFMGFEILADISAGAQELTSHVRRLMAFTPDVFLVCGHFQDSVLTFMAARALAFNPKAILISNGASQSFISAVGAANANYIMAPVSWAQDAFSDNLCRVFGSAEGFAEAYVARWGERPTDLSAQAAAAGVALLSAVEAAGTLKAQAVNDAMLELDTMSFFGQLSFFTNGLRRNTKSITQQVQPLGLDFDPRVRYARSHIATVDEEHPPEWPIPSWDQKELEVYPCVPGETWEIRPESSSLNIDSLLASEAVVSLLNIDMVCMACPIGRYRDASSMHCRPCAAGKYNDQEGMVACKDCPVGTDCPAGRRSGLPKASPGYYILPGELNVASCNPQELCLGSNRCLGANKGLLCEQCEEEHSNKGVTSLGKKCRKCPELGWNLLIACLMFLFVVYIAMLVRKAISSSANIQEIHSVIMKISVNYLQFAGIAFEATEFADMLQEMLQDGSLAFWPLMAPANVATEPLQASVNFQCIFPGHTQVVRASVVAGFLLMPLVITINLAVLWAKRSCRIFWWFRRYKRLRRATQDAIAGDPDMSISTATPSTPSKSIVIDTPLHPEVIDHSPSNEAHAARRAWHALEKKDHNAWLQSSIVWCFVLHAITVRLLLTPLQCVELDVLRLKSNLDVACDDEDHVNWIIWSSIGISIYGLGTPLALYKMLHGVRDRLYQSDVRRKYGFLYNGFETHLYFFEPIHMLRKVALLLMSAVPTRYVRLIGMSFLSCTFLFIHASCQPFDDRGYFCLDILEAVSLRALLLTVLARLIFDVRKELVGSVAIKVAGHPLFDILLVGMVFACHLWFVLLAVWSIFRNTLVKHIKMKADTWPDRITCLERAVLNWAGKYLNKVFLDEETLILDTSQLTRRERFFLFTGLCHTLERYVDTLSKVQLGLVVNAVKEAFQRCKHSREARLARLIQLRARSKGNSVGQIRGELRLSTRGMMTGKTNADLGKVIGRPSMNDAMMLEAMKINKLDKAGASVEELYNHLMLVWPDVLENRSKFFVVTHVHIHEDKRLELASVTPQMMAQKTRGIDESDGKDSSLASSQAFPWREAAARQEDDEQTIRDLLGPPTDLHSKAKSAKVLLNENRELVQANVDLYDQHAALEKQHLQAKLNIGRAAAVLNLTSSATSAEEEDAEYTALSQEHLAVTNAVKEATVILDRAKCAAKAQEQTVQVTAPDATSITDPEIISEDTAPTAVLLPFNGAAPDTIRDCNDVEADTLQFTGCMLQPANPSAWAKRSEAAI